MKTWEKYQQYLKTGEWHIHTSFTDGNDSVDIYCRRAKEIGIPLLAFTEHVRRTLDYDFNCFLSQIERARQQYDLIILSGCEAKVLPDGTLDADNWILRTVDYPIFSFHSFPCDDELLLWCLKRVVKNTWVNTWAHPATWFKKRTSLLNEKELFDIIAMLCNKKILYEVNLKYPDDTLQCIINSPFKCMTFVKGSDIHSSSMLRL